MEKANKLIEEYEKFKEENPLEFNEEELNKVYEDIIKPQKGIVWDEYVDFRLWSRGLKSRQESFADYVTDKLPVDKYKKLLEVGCGRDTRLARILAKREYKVTAMDPKVEENRKNEEGIVYIKDYFDWEKIKLDEFDAVVAQEPCEATEHIVRACIKQEKCFVMSLCGVPHDLLNGEKPGNAKVWYKYLLEISEGKCVLENPKLISGVVSNILVSI